MARAVSTGAYPGRDVLLRIAPELSKFVAGDHSSSGPIRDCARADLEHARDLFSGEDITSRIAVGTGNADMAC